VLGKVLAAPAAVAAVKDVAHSLLFAFGGGF
jgi:hypothetical protein